MEILWSISNSVRRSCGAIVFFLYGALCYLPPPTKLQQGNIFRSVCQEFCSRGREGGWYPSMHCRFPGPHPGGKLRGLAWGSPGPHPGGKLRGLAWGGGVSRPPPGGLQAHTQGGLQAHTWGGLQVHTQGRYPSMH